MDDRLAKEVADCLAHLDARRLEAFCKAQSALEFQLLKSPEDAWQVTLEMIRLCPDDRFFHFIAAGPLEDFLGHHGLAFIARVEEEAARNPAFRRALGGVWKNRIDDEVWERVRRLNPLAGTRF